MPEKDAFYFESLMQDRAQALYDQLTAGKSQREIVEMDEELEERTFMPRLLAEVGRNLPEARALVAALGDAASDPVELIWVKEYPGYDYGKLGQAKLNRTQIIARLEEISFLAFGDSAADWAQWLAAFEADPPMTGYR